MNSSNKRDTKIYKTFLKKMKEFSKTFFNNANDMMFIIGALYLSLTIIMFVRLCFDPAFFISNGEIDPDLASKFGSFIGGLFSPLLTITSTFFLVATLLTQIKSNRRNTVEVAIYKLIDYHKENSRNISLKKNNSTIAEGLDAFQLMVKKYEAIYFKVKSTNMVTEEELIDVSYKLFFHGYRDEQDETLKRVLRIKNNSKYDEFMHTLRYNEVKISYKGTEYLTSEQLEFQLGHYFRNLYNTVKTIDIDKTLSQADKKFYMKLLRTQLSTPEIWLLFINSLSDYGIEWRENGYIEKYELVKNLPFNYSTILEAKDKYPKIEFEYEKFQNNIG